MIVLDEQLTGRGIENAIRRWYRGTVCFVNDLRPGSVIKDEAIPALLASQRQPTFVTINVMDFWERMPAGVGYCMVCLAIPDTRTPEIPDLLRRTMKLPEFKTKRLRMGTILRVGNETVTYYSRTNSDRQTRTL